MLNETFGDIYLWSVMVTHLSRFLQIRCFYSWKPNQSAVNHVVQIKYELGQLQKLEKLLTLKFSLMDRFEMQNLNEFHITFLDLHHL